MWRTGYVHFRKSSFCPPQASPEHFSFRPASWDFGCSANYIRFRVRHREKFLIPVLPKYSSEWVFLLFLSVLSDQTTNFGPASDRHSASWWEFVDTPSIASRGTWSYISWTYTKEEWRYRDTNLGAHNTQTWKVETRNVDNIINVRKKVYDLLLNRTQINEMNIFLGW